MRWRLVTYELRSAKSDRLTAPEAAIAISSVPYAVTLSALVTAPFDACSGQDRRAVVLEQQVVIAEYRSSIDHLDEPKRMAMLPFGEAAASWAMCRSTGQSMVSICVRFQAMLRRSSFSVVAASHEAVVSVTSFRCLACSVRLSKLICEPLVSLLFS